MNRNSLNQNTPDADDKQSNIPIQSLSLRAAYDQYDVEEYYEKFGNSYRNPHSLVVEEIVQQAWQKWGINWRATENLEQPCDRTLDQEDQDFGRRCVLDLACGSGEVTLALEKMGIIALEAIDPFTYKIYQEKTGRIAQRWTFNDIANGVLEGRKYNLIICSFALHLVPISRLPLLLYQLGLISEYLIVITPHKRPEIKPNWGWLYLEEIIWKRVRSRLYHCPRR